MYWPGEPLGGHAAPQYGPYLVEHGHFDDSTSYPSVTPAARCCDGGYRRSDPLLSRASQPYTATSLMGFNDADENQNRYMSPLWTGQPRTLPGYPFSHSMSSESSGTIESRLILSQPASVGGDASPSYMHQHRASVSSTDSSPTEKTDGSGYATSPPTSQASPAIDNPKNHLSHEQVPEHPDIKKETSQQYLLTCGNDPIIQSAVRSILDSQQYKDKEYIPFELMAPLLKGCGNGKRGAFTSYKCLWGGCSQAIPRKLHAKEHIMAHLDHRLHICPDCGSGFVRKNELKKHLDPCKRNKGRNSKFSKQRSKRIRKVTMSRNPTPGNGVSATSGPVNHAESYQSVVSFNPSPTNKIPLSGTFDASSVYGLDVYPNSTLDISRSTYQSSPTPVAYYSTSAYPVYAH